MYVHFLGQEVKPTAKGCYGVVSGAVEVHFQVCVCVWTCMCARVRVCVRVCDVIKMVTLSHVFAEEDIMKPSSPQCRLRYHFAIPFTTPPGCVWSSFSTGNHVSHQGLCMGISQMGDQFHSQTAIRHPIRSCQTQGQQPLSDFV